MDNTQLKALGIAFRDDTVLAQAYGRARLQLILPVHGLVGVALDLNALPKKPFDFKEIFLKWALFANRERIAAGKEPLFTAGLVQACPLWKLVPPPYTSLTLDKDSLLKTVGRNSKVIGTASGGAMKRSNRNIR